MGTSTASVETPVAELERLFLAMREAYARDPMPSLETRKRRLRAVLEMIERHEPELVAAISADFGNRYHVETSVVGIITSIAEIRHALRHLRRWMRPQRVSTPFYLLPARARIERQPVGVVGVIGPWNYPMFLAIPPVVGALAAGNRVLLKPSELTPRFSELLQKLVAERFAEDEFRVVVGGREVGEALTHLPLNHLFFTGSTQVGRAVARAAAENLTPVTLELGGKSPAIIGTGIARLQAAARSVAYGKLLNAGQTCIAPDYCFVPRAQLREFAELVRAAAARLYPDAATNPQYTSMIHDRGMARLLEMVYEARDAGTEVLTVGDIDVASRRMPLHIVLDPRNSLLMCEEIFGPVLPIVPYDTIDDAIHYINRGPRPLALYYFGDNRREQRRVLDWTVSGGVTINDTLWHIAHPNLPFGGSGDSGQGAYHGEYSFRRFSHEKAVLVQSRWATSPLLHPPYGRAAQWTVKMLRRFI